ncbi:MAG TPA: hypothetical protein VL122_08120 [Nitrospirota bacterium]|nr:hypothetical protein [Nitrospirota bacterium]
MGGSVLDGSVLGQHLSAVKDIALTRILLGQGVYSSWMVFAAGQASAT